MPPRDSRKVHVPAPGPGAPGLPPRLGSPPQSAIPSQRPANPPASTSPPPRVQKAIPSTPPPRSTEKKPAAKVPPKGKRRRFLPGRPKLRRVLLLTSILMPLLLLATAVGTWLYARSIYDKVEKIPLADVLTTSSEGGTNYLIVGSDSRDVEDLVDAGLDPAAFQEGGGQRSDTMLLLRFADGKSTMMSIPRDLYVPIAETGGSAKINAAYNGGPRRLVLTVQQALGLPVHHYLEVDFVSFARLVDALGGITIDFENPASDAQTGLQVDQTGPVHLDGPQSLAYVRSRHYVEVIDGQRRTDPTGDLGRVQRQQRFLSAVFAELGDQRNPFTLLRAAKSASSGLAVDDTLGLVDAVRLAWRLRSLDPTSVPLPVRNGANSAGSVLFLVEPDAEAALQQFR